MRYNAGIVVALAADCVALKDSLCSDYATELDMVHRGTGITPDGQAHWDSSITASQFKEVTLNGPNSL